MDQVALVDDRIHDGQKLVEQLAAVGFDVTAAFWVQTSEDRRWMLYIASKTVDEKGPGSSYLLVFDALNKTDAPWVSMSDVTLISPNNPIAADVLAILRSYAGTRAVRSRNRRLGEVDVEEVIIYPQLPLGPKVGAKVQANLQKFIDQGWKVNGQWEDGYPRVQWGKLGFVVQVRVDEEMTPDKVPSLVGQAPNPFGETHTDPQLQ